MSTRPIIFISAVSKELHSARDLIAKTLTALGYEPKWQDIAATETGPLPQVLRDWIAQSDAVFQLVGHCYGFGPAEDDPNFGRCSYTQYEALYARQQGKKVYYLFTDATHPTDGCGCEPKALHELQEKYRQSVKAYGHLYHGTSSLTQTELLVRRLKDDLAELRTQAKASEALLHQKSDQLLHHQQQTSAAFAHLRRRGKLYAALVMGFLVLGGVLMMRTQIDSKREIEEMRAEHKKAQTDLRQMIETIKGGSESKLTADYDVALRFIAQKRGIGLAAFSAYLDQNATQALGDDSLSLKEKVRALQEAGKFVQSRDFALEHARRLEAERQKNSKEEVELWTEAAKTEFTLGHYDKSLEYAIKAVSQTDRQADFPTWSAARHQQGRALSYVRKDKEALALYEELIPLQQAALGPDDLAVLQSRRFRALIISDQGNYALGEQQGRALIADCQRALGLEHRETLASRNNLASVLDSQGRHAEAEQEHRAVLKIRGRVLGAEHPETLVSRNNVATALRPQGKHAEAEKELKDVLLIKKRVLGAEHPSTLTSRNNLAFALEAQGKHAEAEKELTEVLLIKERVLGAEHPSTLKSRNNLAKALNSQGKHAEAELQQVALLQVKERVLGAEHPSTLSSGMNRANALNSQGKHAEAEQEYRQMLKIRERVLGAEHPQVARSLYNLALCLEAQQKLTEALQFVQQAEQVWMKSLGADHSHTKLAIAERERLEAALKQTQTQPPPQAK